MTVLQGREGQRKNITTELDFWLRRTFATYKDSLHTIAVNYIYYYLSEMQISMTKAKMIKAKLR